jgi:hypothetical protein
VWLQEGVYEVFYMFLSCIDTLLDSGEDYALLLDYGSEGIVVDSQYETISQAMQARSECTLGVKTAIVKICRIENPKEA